MNQQLPLSDDAIAPHRGAWKYSHEVLPDVAYLRIQMVNVVLIGGPNSANWILIDAGVGDASETIRRAAAERFGPETPPAAIVLTHGHFDHVGALPQLADTWNVPVFAHAREQPFLNGSMAYPPPDTKADGGIMPKLAAFMSRDPINLGDRLNFLPASGKIPGLPGWRWIATPGHTPGHVSLWREADRCVVAGDAFITTRQESAYAILTQEPEMHGPPRYFTPDWDAARVSVRQLAALEPELAVTGHGRAMRGAEMRTALHRLATDFDRIARPHGESESARA